MKYVKKQKNKTLTASPKIWAVLLALSLAAVLFVGVRLALELRTYSAASAEYKLLQEKYAPDANLATSKKPSDAQQTENTTPKNLVNINKDYIGWLRIDSVNIEYPVVQGADNDKYLATTFEGESNRLGAVFMDYRCKGGFDAPYTILYGHNAKDGSMFAGLRDYLDNEFLLRNPVLDIFLADGTKQAYRILSCRSTDISNKAYDFEAMKDENLAAFAHELGAPQGTKQLLALSTCTNRGVDERILLLAYPEKN